MQVTVYAPAKINLTLDVTGRRDDGYHLIDSVMQTVSLHDIVTVRSESAGGICLAISDERLPCDHTNTAWKAAEAFFRRTGLTLPGLHIRVQKHIPCEAGLAGGSADAAGVLVALNILTDARLDLDTLCDIGGEVGADVPFCVMGGAARCTGTGSILDPLPPMPPCWLVIARPSCGVSTAEAYRLLDHSSIPRHPHTSVMTDAVCCGDLDTIGREVCNVFEPVMDLPEVSEIRSRMQSYKAMGRAMTGSGSAVFGIFDERTYAQRCADELKKQMDCVHLCRPVGNGPVLKNE